MIRVVKRTALSAMKTAGVFDIAVRSRWRHDRLLILGYHGISQQGEHLWNPALFITPELLDARIRFLRGEGFNILPLQEALSRLHNGTLPARSVVLTFDDGYVDFYRLAQPILQQHDAPATVYLTTYYADRGQPIPGITASYMVWMSPGFTGSLRTVPGFERVDFSSDTQRRAASQAIGQRVTDDRTMSPPDKQRLLQRLADELGFDLEGFKAARHLHLMSPAEVREVAARGIDVQLHTHRHWVPPDKALVTREIRENREQIEAWTGQKANHFCYPSGVYYPQLLVWLRELNIASATTCEPGLASPTDPPLQLPRFIDHSLVTQVEFEAWATGVLSVLPRRGRLLPAVTGSAR